jgi:signal transduction histidine kinase
MSRGVGLEAFELRPLGWWRRLLAARSPALLVLLFAGVSLVAASQLFLDSEPATVQLIEVGVPTALSLPILYVVVHARADREPGALQRHALILSTLFGAIGIGMVTLVLWSQTYHGAPPVDPIFPLAVSVATASGIGSVSGMMYNDLAKTKLELSEEVQRTRTLNQQLKVVNRVLRHNVRNTLASVYGTLETVRSEISRPALLDRLDDCSRSLDRLKRRADKTLYTERLVANRARARSDVAAVLDATVTELENRHDGATLETTIPDKATVLAHPLVTVAIEEAVENAVMHNEGCKPHLEVAVDVGVDSVNISISDDGPGISSAEIEAIELDEETPLNHASGVGLWLITWIVDASDGTLRFTESDMGGQTVEMEFERA